MIATIVTRGTPGVPNISERERPVRLEMGFAEKRYRCRCGTEVVAGARCFQFQWVPAHLESLLGDQAFCTIACARAHLLEAMEFLETPGTACMISDVREVLWSLQVMYTMVENHLHLRA